VLAGEEAGGTPAPATSSDNFERVKQLVADTGLALVISATKAGEPIRFPGFAPLYLKNVDRIDVTVRREDRQKFVNALVGTK
jgi:hypothetical protein